MADYIINTFKGVKVTLAVTGLPVVITGEVLGSSTQSIINIKLDSGITVNINSSLIAFVF
ncbi:hypothetical protein [Clostridium saccharoperbutylacetonicum]|uniref:hypothetical protein n=1 Tax=Clostridium saccharoperbutylacetonicum TaxID=36745 RepID=UPI0039E853E1